MIQPDTAWGIVLGQIHPLETTTVPLGEARACHIGPVMSRLGIRIDPSSIPCAGGEVVERAWSETGDTFMTARIAALEKA